MVACSCGDKQQDQPQPPLRHDKDNRVRDRYPDQCDGDDFRSQWDGFVLAEVTDIRPEMRLPEKPCVQARGTAHVECCREQ